MKQGKLYVVSRVPSDKLDPGHQSDKVYYCHMRNYPNIPVFGSIGSYQKAKAVCKSYNESARAV